MEGGAGVPITRAVPTSGLGATAGPQVLCLHSEAHRCKWPRATVESTTHSCGRADSGDPQVAWESRTRAGTPASLGVPEQEGDTSLEPGSWTEHNQFSLEHAFLVSTFSSLTHARLPCFRVSFSFSVRQACVGVRHWPFPEIGPTSERTTRLQARLGLCPFYNNPTLFLLLI